MKHNPEKSYHNPDRLLYTRRGTNWIEQFNFDDRIAARRLIHGLTLVSSREFDGGVKKLIDSEIAHTCSPIASYAVREVKKSRSYFEQARSATSTYASNRRIDAIGPGPQIGSEGRVAALITQVSRANPGVLLNHPNLNTIRKNKCRSVLLIDDLVGSGNRVIKFLNAIWLDPTIRSWTSFGLIRFKVLVFAATVKGRTKIETSGRHASVIYDRICPTFRMLPWSIYERNQCLTISKTYGQKTNSPSFSLGYQGTMASLVFDHGCPNNTPAILWAKGRETQTWHPLFPNRAIATEEHSVFPPEIANRVPKSVLLEAGLQRLSRGSVRVWSHPEMIVIMLLGLIAKGYRRDEALTFSSGLSNREMEARLRRCMECGWITPSRRITRHGLAELRNARQTNQEFTGTPPIGDDYYYPQALREIA